MEKSTTGIKGYPHFYRILSIRNKKIIRLSEIQYLRRSIASKKD